VVKVSVILW